MKIEESLNVTFDESLPPTKLSPLVDDDVGEEEAIENNIKVVNNNNIEDESIEVDDVINIKESKNHPLGQDIEPKNVNEFEMSMMGELNFFLGLQVKQMEDEIFFNQSKYIKEMLKKFGLKDSKPTKTPMSREIKLTKDDEADSVDSTKYRAIGNRDHVQASIALMLYFLETERPYNLAYFIVMRMSYFRDRFDKVLPYGMIVTRLFKNLKASIKNHPFDGHYTLVPRTKRPPPKRTRNVGKSKRAQLSSFSSSE
ncbi:retrovirus-related pol polyprotein from transposon TNT 1-94 [Tanacetum coccineum]